MTRFRAFIYPRHTPGAVPVPPELTRLDKFIPECGGPHPMAPPPEEPTHECPYTLDLRKSRSEAR